MIAIFGEFSSETARKEARLSLFAQVQPVFPTRESAKSATTARGNIIRVRVHQPGKPKDIYVHTAHLLNMIVLHRRYKIVDVQKVYTGDKKKRDYTNVACVSVRNG